MISQKLKILAAGALAATTMAASPALAQDSKVEVGVLTCDVAGGAGFIFGSSKDLSCRFESADGSVERYAGEINKYGIDIGFTDGAKMNWTVFAPSTSFSNDTLAGTYLGASAEATAGVGGGANVLVGGSEDTISLQPISVQGQTGLNAALGVAELILYPV